MYFERFKPFDFAGEILWPFKLRISFSSRYSISISFPVNVATSTVDSGATTTKGIPAYLQARATANEPILFAQIHLKLLIKKQQQRAVSILLEKVIFWSY